jgi:hypothetical protein
LPALPDIHHDGTRGNGGVGAVPAIGGAAARGLPAVMLTPVIMVSAPDPTVSGQRLTALLAPLVAAASLALGTVLAGHPWPGRAGFLVVIFLAVLVRRHGPRGLTLWPGPGLPGPLRGSVGPRAAPPRPRAGHLPGTVGLARAGAGDDPELREILRSLRSACAPVAERARALASAVEGTTPAGDDDGEPPAPPRGDSSAEVA